MQGSQQTDSISVKVIQDAASMSALSEAWDELLENAVDAPPYLSRAWINTFIDQKRLQGRPLFVTAWAGEKLVALFPLAVRKFLSIKIAVPISTGQPSYLGLLIDSNYLHAIDQMIDVFDKKKVADVLIIEDLFSEDKATNTFFDHLSRNKFLCLSTYRNPCYRIQLDCSFDDYLKKQKTGKRRRKILYDERKLLQSTDVRILSYAGKDITGEVNARVAQIHLESWMKKRGAAVLGRPFYQKLLMNMAQAGFGRVWIMTIDGDDAAFAYSFVIHSTLHYYWPAFKLRYKSNRSGTVLLMRILRDVCEEGILAFDFGHGDAEYKRFWANECHVVSRLVAGRGLGGRAIAVWKFLFWRLARIQWLRSFYKRLKKYLNRLTQ